MSEILLIILHALGASLLVAAVAWLVLRQIRRRSVGASVGVVVVSAIVSVLLGVLVVSWKMFLSAHDLSVTLIVLGCATVVSFGTVWWLAKGLRTDAVWADEMRAQERRMEHSRRELVAWVSHDLRTPLAGIRAMAEALEDKVVTDQESVDDYHHRLRQEADRMAGLVDDLFELSRINAGAMQLSLARVNLAEVLSDAIASATPLARARGIELQADPMQMTAVIGSEAELGRVVRNLLINAIRFTPADGTVVLHAGTEGASAWFAVSDSCGGIPVDDLPRVFDVAFRGEEARSKEAAATGGGLGLAIARGLVEAHRGAIDIRNENQGCRVTVRIPAAV